MVNFREILRLRSLGYSITQIAAVSVLAAMTILSLTLLWIASNTMPTR